MGPSKFRELIIESALRMRVQTPEAKPEEKLKPPREPRSSKKRSATTSRKDEPASKSPKVKAIHGHPDQLLHSAKGERACKGRIQPPAPAQLKFPAHAPEKSSHTALTDEQQLEASHLHKPTVVQSPPQHYRDAAGEGSASDPVEAMLPREIQAENVQNGQDFIESFAVPDSVSASFENDSSELEAALDTSAVST